MPVADMHQRKAEMARQSDAFIALPGKCKISFLGKFHYSPETIKISYNHKFHEII